MDDLRKVALKLGKDGPVRTLQTPRLIQVLFNGRYIVKTTKSVFVWEHPFYPQLYIPASEIKSYFEARSEDLKLTPGQEIKGEDDKVIATQWTFTVSDKSVEKILAFATDLPEPSKELSDLVKIDFASMDQWFEESTPIFVHPKDPFKRIDILQSTRHIRVSIAGQVVADTDSSMHLYETGLPCRYYLPLTRVDASVLRPSKTLTQCPYKGEAEYYSVEIDGKIYEDVIWYYNRPLLESARVEGLVCFYNEKVDIELDGEVLEKPISPFANRKPGDKPNLD
ncbi:hypothetical protein AC579_9698 [Pseudocercospora musae]|uniref:DUF427 domain-containing protein n=1 Tax=Pseudocercospora musae TaxID=113226 RepID=A0A139I6E7_9PEZI|nr:hypothetical protein AC579_9698 [Pseudocercospora musae]